MGDAISQTAKKVLEVVKPSLSLPGTPEVVNTEHQEHPDNPSQDLADLGGEEQMEVHEADPTMLEPCELTSNTQPRSEVDLAPKRNGNSNNSQHDEIMKRLNELSTKLQNLGESSVGQQPGPSQARINYFPPWNQTSANYHNPNPGVSAKLKQEIQSGEYFEISKLGPGSNKDSDFSGRTVELSFQNQILRTKPVRPKPITNIEEWSTAFSTYMAVIVEKFPNRALELIEYLRLIRYAASHSPGLGWVAYDHQFRTQAANNKDIYWGTMDMQLWVKIFCVSASRLREE